jgi:uncharacterized MnhB-related membrane protein
MTIVLVLAVLAAVLVFLWKIDAASAVLFGDPRPVILNGLILILFFLGIMALYRGVKHYARQEAQITDFMERRAEGYSSDQILTDLDDPSLLRVRYTTIKELFEGGGPVDHGAISSIMLAGESLQLSFPRFVNNVLILTGVFGTVSSLIFALIGATDVLQNAAPGSGMGLLLLGMNTALTTTATAIVCYFFFTYFYQKLTDVQTYLFSQIEQAVLLYIIPDFAFDSESINHETKALIQEANNMVRVMQSGIGTIERTLVRLNDHNEVQIQKWDSILSRQEDQSSKLDGLLSSIVNLREVLREGFRLR